MFNQSVQHVLKFFSYNHPPASLQKVSQPFHDLAIIIANNCPENPETVVALRKLLEAKDAAVRSCV